MAETDELTPESIDVRRNLPLAVSVGLAALVLAVAFVVRAVGDGAMLDWIAFGVLSVIAAAFLAAAADSRTPLLIADDQGVRLREGSNWRGIAWAQAECVEHLPRRGLRDGHVLVLGPQLEQLVVPLTLATRVAGATRQTMSDDLAAMAAGRTDVVEVVPGIDDEDDLSDGDTDVEATADIPRVPATEPTAEVEPTEEPVPDDDAVAEPHRMPGLVRSLLHRAGRSGAPAIVGATALDPDPETETLPEVDELHYTDPDDLDETRVRAVRVVGAESITTTETATVVLGDMQVQPAADPVIGRELRAARERIRISVDQLAERTRIRPHVLEAMEADDFAPCGGDFYARGHLRTLGRVLGVEAGPLVATYDEKYADAPVDPKRIFQSELATGASGTLRGTRGGRNWSVLVAAVMAAVLIWSIARLVMDGPVPVGDAPVLNQSGGIANGVAQAEAVPVTLTAVGGGAKVVVRDGGGDIIFDGRLAFGQSTQLDVAPPVRISSSDGSVTASLDSAEATPLGETGEDVTKTLVP